MGTMLFVRRLLRHYIHRNMSVDLFAPPSLTPASLHLRPYHGDGGVSYGLNSALAARGVIVEDKVFLNLSPSELKQKGATIAECLLGYPIHIRRTVTGGSEISKAQFSKLLKKVTSHLSSISDIFVHDGAIGSSSKCSARVRVISDSPSAVLSLSNILWSASTREVSRDTCPITTYIASSISGTIGDAIGLGSQDCTGLIAADTERSSLILCGEAFTDANGVKKSLMALSEPILAARGGIPLAARILELGDLVVLLFAADDVIWSVSDQLVSSDSGVILASQEVSPFFRTKKSNSPSSYKLPAAIILACSDSSGVYPVISRLSPGQAAYHFLVGYQNGECIPAFNTGPSCIDPLELSKALFAKLKDASTNLILININDGEKHIKGEDILQIIQSAFSTYVSFFHPKGGALKLKLKRFLLSKYPELPEDFSF